MQTDFYAFRYFDNLDDPFKNIFDLEFKQWSDYENYALENNFIWPSSYNNEYFLSRVRTEENLYKLFTSVGGKPLRKHPHYMTLGCCDEWFRYKKNFSQCIAIPLSYFDVSSLSFTYGDSYPTFNNMWKTEREYRNRIYTFNEIVNIIHSYGWPQDWNPLEQIDIENYIEIQVWSDETVNNYRLFDVEFESDDFYNRLQKLTKAAIRARKELSDNLIMASQMHLKELFGLLINSVVCKRIVLNQLNNLRHSLFERNHIHGIFHAVKVMIFAICLGVLCGINDHELNLLANISLYHDIGRKFGGNNENHGIIGAEIFKKHFTNLNEKEMEIALCAIVTHSSPIAEHNAILSHYVRCEQQNLSRIINQCLMDADSLDIIRFGLDRYCLNYLRLPYSSAMTSAAIEYNLLSHKYIKDIIQWTLDVFDNESGRFYA
jgi:hypothetical protein